jgi:hypothetical protein
MIVQGKPVAGTSCNRFTILQNPAFAVDPQANPYQSIGDAEKFSENRSYFCDSPLEPSGVALYLAHIVGV